MTILNDKSMALKRLLGLVLEFCQFCHGLALSVKKVGNVTKSIRNMIGYVKEYMTKLYIYLYLLIYISLYALFLQVFEFCQGLYDKTLTKVIKV